MSEKKLKSDMARLLKMAEDLSALADSVRALCRAPADGPRKQEKPKPEKGALAVTLEKDRGMLTEKSYDIREVSMTIFQPRRENVSTWTVSVEELKDWAENELKPKAVMAYNGEGEYLPGEWYTFCRAAVRCRARAEEKLRLAQTAFLMPPLLTDAEIEDILAVLPDLHLAIEFAVFWHSLFRNE